jgi:hypothetical protein
LRGLLSGSAWVLCWELCARAALADEEAVRVAYTAPASCPDEQVFIQQVRGRTQHGRFAGPSELARTFAVTLAELSHDQGFSGQIEFIDVDSPRSQRRVTGATCDEVVASLALILALSIDDRVALSTEGAPAPAAVATPAAQPRPDAAPAVVASRTEPAPHRSAPLALGWQLGAHAAALSWVAPKVAVALGAFLELDSRPRGWSARLSAFDARQTAGNDLGQAKFVTDWLRAEFCPVSFRAGAHGSLAPCAAFDAGVLRASGSGSGLKDSFSKPLFWASGDLLLRFGWEFAQRLVLSLDGELGAPLIRHVFVFENPATRLFRVPALGAGAKVSVGVRFP